MHLTKYSDYSLRVLMATAAKHPELVSISEIAAIFKISEAHIRKIMHQLSVAGFLESVRGRHGGFRLGRDPASISLGKVVRFTENELKIVECFDPSSGMCRLEPNCVLKSVLGQALAAFLKVLDQYTLADLVRKKQGIAELLGF